MARLSDRRVDYYNAIRTPVELKELLPLTETAAVNVSRARQDIEDILDRHDSRKIIIIGPCSIHNEAEAVQYAESLKRLSLCTSDKLLIVMRAYFEKPRTVLGWKGLIYDPHLDGSEDIDAGLFLSRGILIKLAELDVPAAMEFLGVWTPQYFDDLISYAAIGARTCESQPHREMASGLSMPVGFKNSTSGDIDGAVNAALAAAKPHKFVGVDNHGKVCVVKTTGNPYGHLILRGGNGRANYAPELVREAAAEMERQALSPKIIIDCSHGNSNRDTEKQKEVFKEVSNQIVKGNPYLFGAMMESNIIEGNQDFQYKVTKPSSLKYGLSITDSCIGLKNAEGLVKQLYDQM